MLGVDGVDFDDVDFEVVVALVIITSSCCTSSCGRIMISSSRLSILSIITLPLLLEFNFKSTFIFFCIEISVELQLLFIITSSGWVDENKVVVVVAGKGQALPALVPNK